MLLRNMMKEAPQIPLQWIEPIKELLELNDFLIKLRQQQFQYEAAIKEMNIMKKDIKDKKITKVLVPTFGNNFVQVNPSNKRYQDLLKDKERQFENSIAGIKGQIEHRENLLNEQMLRTYGMIGKYLLSQGLELPKEESK